MRLIMLAGARGSIYYVPSMRCKSHRAVTKISRAFCPIILAYVVRFISRVIHRDQIVGDKSDGVVASVAPRRLIARRWARYAFCHLHLSEGILLSFKSVHLPILQSLAHDGKTCRFICRSSASHFAIIVIYVIEVYYSSLPGKLSLKSRDGERDN